MEFDLTPFVNAGIPGIMLVWFMFRLERMLRAQTKALNQLSLAIFRLLERTDPAEARRLSKEMGAINGG